MPSKTYAQHIFLTLGLSKGKPKNLWSQLYHAAVNSDRFEKLEGGGVFRLKPQAKDHTQPPLTFESREEHE